MKKAFADLQEFETACGNDGGAQLPLVPNIPDRRTMRLRATLIEEECNELIFAIEFNDFPGIADGIADLIYVALGTAVRYGIDMVPIWNAVHSANMAKFGPGSYRDDAGKIQKPPGWKHPDIAAILMSQSPLSYPANPEMEV